MRTPLEITIARLQWRKEENRLVNQRKEREFESKLEATYEGFKDEIAQLKKVHDDEIQTQIRVSREEYNVLKKEHDALLVELGQLNRAQLGSEMNLQKLHQEIDAYDRRQGQAKRSFQEALEESQLELQSKDKQLLEAKTQLGRYTALLDARDQTIQGLRDKKLDLIGDLEASRQHESQYRELLRKERERFRYRERTLDLELLNMKKISDEKTQELTKKLRREETRRRSLFEKVQELQGAIRVICRIRPDSSRDLLEYEVRNGEFHGDPASLSVIDEKRTVWGDIRPTKSEIYEFERIFGPQDTNHDVFDEISNFVQSVIDGKKACIFCYGQSGTGKTYTMSNVDSFMGRKEGVDYQNDGIIPRVKTMLFKEKERLEEIDFVVNIRGCCYEIYNNQLWLLKSGGREKKSISRNTRSVKDPGLKRLNHSSDFDDMVEIGMNNRHFGVTKLNNNSSRSHFIISLETSVMSKNTPEALREGILNLVDLAGSERTHQAGTTGAKLQEGNNINASLTQLWRVFINLSEGKIPTYNGNILTEFLQRSLEKGCMTLMFLMISLLKENWPATKQTLQFALDAQSARKSGRGTKAAPARPLSGKQQTAGQKPGNRK
ncbi:P-loop containing nucleoside triphosphate hydrolase protein [Annulohypoxylon maeteangense]|uniref:P-loop containing nucleoside triphosphate hydrolase protein n=1 Tax=Annulohypoxylon maeteangense TaxID=1927788 RepID=UPI002007FEE8|nr:P-loop containing nucleoside triphosphate hydrolase protein [Annulohypoxylon maeteangense]KAI0888749.1 P-loop containing nucleoside triphosphate hydrolase protein [Annulohypoxylon maeteangense]